MTEKRNATLTNDDTPPAESVSKHNIAECHNAATGLLVKLQHEISVCGADTAHGALHRKHCRWQRSGRSWRDFQNLTHATVA